MDRSLLVFCFLFFLFPNRFFSAQCSSRSPTGQQQLAAHPRPSQEQQHAGTHVAQQRPVLFFFRDRFFFFLLDRFFEPPYLLNRKSVFGDSNF